MLPEAQTEVNIVADELRTMQRCQSREYPITFKYIVAAAIHDIRADVYQSEYYFKVKAQHNKLMVTRVS